MENKYNTDIDRKLAIYYHPLFQQILSFISKLFNKNGQFELGLLQFLQFNLKLQKSLLPTFEIENAIVSGLNDWVKQVAECLSFEGMISTVGCVQVNPQNIIQLITTQIRKCCIQLLHPESEYKNFLKEFQKHDAFRLLGVTINHEVFCKFLFDLCSTWCEFLDIELFGSFILTLILQMTQGQSLETSKFKPTAKVTCINLQFLQNFQNDKQEYSLYKKRQLRYYRAWCEWNYLRMVEIGQKIIIDLCELFPDDSRIHKISALFETSIDTINEEVTLQAKVSKQQAPSMSLKEEKPQQFLIFKKLETKSNTLRQEITFVKNESTIEQFRPQVAPNEYEIEVDDKGYMYLKPIIKMPVLGNKISLRPQNQNQKKLFLLKKQQDQCRLSSNLYCHTGFHVSFKHEAVKPKQEQHLELKDKFYKPKSTVQRKSNLSKNSQTFIQKKSMPKKSVSQYEEAKVPAKQEQIQQYKYQVMAPVFLTNKQHNISYNKNNYEIYGNHVAGEKRHLEFNFPKICYNDIKSTTQGKHIVGKFLTDRQKIRDRITNLSYMDSKKKDYSSSSGIMNQSYQQSVRLNNLKEKNKHVWSRYINEQEMSKLTDFKEFYNKLAEFKKQFSNEFRSDYMNMLNIEIAYCDKRCEMGGVYTRQDKQKFTQRISRLIARDNRRKKRPRRRNKKGMFRKEVVLDNQKKFKNRTAKSLFNYVFVDFHRDKIKQIRSSFQT